MKGMKRDAVEQEQKINEIKASKISQAVKDETCAKFKCLKKDMEKLKKKLEKFKDGAKSFFLMDAAARASCL